MENTTIDDVIDSDVMLYTYSRTHTKEKNEYDCMITYAGHNNSVDEKMREF